MQDAILGDEEHEEDFDNEVRVGTAEEIQASVLLHNPCFTLTSSVSQNTPLTQKLAFDRKFDASIRLDAAFNKGVPVLNPRTKWIGDAYNGAIPVATCIRKFDDDSVKNGLHVLDLFSGITCGGLRTVLEAGFTISCYTSIEIDNISRDIARCTLSALQSEYPGQLPDKAIRGYNKRLPQDVTLIN